MSKLTNSERIDPRHLVAGTILMISVRSESDNDLVLQDNNDQVTKAFLELVEEKLPELVDRYGSGLEIGNDCSDEHRIRGEFRGLLRDGILYLKSDRPGSVFINEFSEFWDSFPGDEAFWEWCAKYFTYHHNVVCQKEIHFRQKQGLPLPL